MNETSKKWADLGERAAWTVVQSGVALSAVELLDLPEFWFVLLAGALAGVKGYLASRVGNGTAATLPQHLERQ